jgi:hypothetical protein
VSVFDEAEPGLLAARLRFALPSGISPPGVALSLGVVTKD